MADASATPGQIALAAFASGLVAAVIEMVFVLPIQWIVLHTAPERVFQFIAMGAAGKAALGGGWAAAFQGVFWHLLVSIGAAAVFASASTRWQVLLKRPVMSGLGFGALVYFVMIFGVIPMSAIGFNMPKASVLTLVSFTIHLIGFGLPIALVNRALLCGAAMGRPGD